MSKAVPRLGQFVAGFSQRSPGFNIAVTMVWEEPLGLAFKLDVGDIRFPRNAENNLRNCILLETNDHSYDFNVNIVKGP
jgi:hypothetical protein